MIHLKYFLQKFIQLHSIFLKWWNVSKSLTMFFISTWWGNWQTVSGLQFWSAISLTIHIARRAHISENLSTPVCTEIAAPPHGTQHKKLSLLGPVLLHTQKAIAIIEGGGMLRFWNVSVLVLVLVLNFESFFCDLLASVGLVNKNGCKDQH